MTGPAIFTQTISGATTSNEFNIVGDYARINISGASSLSTKLQWKSPTYGTWHDVTDNDGVVKTFTLDGTYKMDNFISGGRYRFNQASGTSTIYEVIQ